MTKETISQIKAQLKLVTSLDDELLKALQSDPRKGVQSALLQTTKRLRVAKEQLDQFHQRFNYEKQFWHQGYQIVAGVDEVGRGPLAGPVVACAVVLDEHFNLVAVNDSKKLSKEKRIELAPQIKEQIVSYGIGIADNHLIDQINIYEATRVAMKQAVMNLNLDVDEIIVDAMTIDLDIPQTRLIKGDAKSISVSAASILAKVYRDHLMDEYAAMYPEYDFLNNSGYGTKKHLDALAKYGPTPIHRMTFAPVSDYI